MRAKTGDCARQRKKQKPNFRVPGGPKCPFHVHCQKKTDNHKEDKATDRAGPTMFIFQSFLLTLSLSNTLFANGVQSDKAVQHSVPKYANTILIAVDT